jgi:hypothetical protein
MVTKRSRCWSLIKKICFIGLSLLVLFVVDVSSETFITSDIISLVGPDTR